MPPSNSVITYRYLRVAMILLVVGLAAAVLREMVAVGFDCAQDSISSYYYTPAQGVFVGVLVAIGVCLVAIKGSTDVEDVLLNIAGMLAPVVAFVPTPYVAACYSTPVDTERVQANVANNMLALLVMGFAALVVARFFRPAAGSSTNHRLFVAGGTVSLLIFLVFGAVFALARDFFVSAAHYGAAIPLFGCIIAVAGINAWHLGNLTPGASRRTYWTNRYALIAGGMIGSLVLGAVLDFGFGWAYWLLAVEALLIALFAVFWGLQTFQLWDKGLWYGEGPVRLRDTRPNRLDADPDALEGP
jgi:hypothetical protein